MDKGEWVIGVCGCCKYPGTAVLGCFCPCCLHGKAAEEMHYDFYAFCCCYGSSAMLRALVRQRDNIPGGCVSDMCLGVCCMCCSATQIFIQARDGAGKFVVAIAAEPVQMDMS
eukprot:Platyproteum_vivax@DN7241_c0_g1_i1.p2